MEREARITAELPEHFALLYNYKTGLFNTPLDPQGIADIDKTVELAIRTFPDTLPSFSAGERNIHHLYWTESWWKKFANTHSAEEATEIMEFRNSPPQLAYVPVSIHAWIEEIMVPPPPPPFEAMERRNAAWATAILLLKSAKLVDEAREDYKENSHRTRTVLGHIPGVTPRSKQKPFDTKEVTDREYWLSELNSRLEGWRALARSQVSGPDEFRIITDARLVSARALRNRIHRGRAMIPQLPEDLLLSA